METGHYPQHKCGDSWWFSKDLCCNLVFVDPSSLPYKKKGVSIASTNNSVHQRHKWQDFNLNWILGAIIKLAQETKSCESCLYF